MYAAETPSLRATSACWRPRSIRSSRSRRPMFAFTFDCGPEGFAAIGYLRVAASTNLQDD